MTSPLENAIAYARAGLRVFPIRARSKEPLTEHGFHDATTDEATVLAWWRRWPTAGVAISCAASGLTIIDTDPRDGGDVTFAALLAELGALPRTAVVFTPGGGAHYYFRVVAFRPRGKLGAGVDVKHDGYVLAPPSVHPNGGTYEWEDGASIFDVAPAELPTGWLERLRPPPPPARTARVADVHAPKEEAEKRYAFGALARATAAVERAGDGERNSTLNRETWSLVRFVDSGKLSEGLVRRALLDAAHAAGLPEREAAKTIESAFRSATRRAS